jgi:FMN phosphatase YigB (HAD superfamily)
VLRPFVESSPALNWLVAQPMIRNVVIDLDDTLVASREAGMRALGFVCSVMEVDRTRFDDTSTRWWGWFHRGICTLQECHFGQWADCGLTMDRARQAHWLYFSESCRVRAKPGARQFLRRLRSAGLRVAILTNGSGVFQRAKLRRAGLVELVDFIGIDSEVGLSKPDPRAFQAAVSALGGTLDSTAMIGDNYQLDIVGALGAGFASAFWVVERRPTSIADPRVQPIKRVDESLRFLTPPRRPHQRL